MFVIRDMFSNFKTFKTSKTSKTSKLHNFKTYSITIIKLNLRYREMFVIRDMFSKDLYDLEAVTRRCSVKKVFLAH